MELLNVSRNLFSYYLTYLPYLTSLLSHLRGVVIGKVRHYCCLNQSSLWALDPMYLSSSSLMIAIEPWCFVIISVFFLDDRSVFVLLRAHSPTRKRNYFSTVLFYSANDNQWPNSTEVILGALAPTYYTKMRMLERIKKTHPELLWYPEELLLVLIDYISTKIHDIRSISAAQVGILNLSQAYVVRHIHSIWCLLVWTASIFSIGHKSKFRIWRVNRLTHLDLKPWPCYLCEPVDPVARIIVDKKSFKSKYGFYIS